MAANRFALHAATDIVVQPYGCFVSNRQSNQFFVLNKSATAHILALHTGQAGELDYDLASTDGIEKMLLDANILVNRTSRVEEPTILPNSANETRYVRADIEITNRCNLACEYCYAEVNRSTFELGFEKWVEILSSLHSRGLRAVLFSGGEPFIRQDFLEILEWASGRFIVEVNSNGRYLTDDVVDRLQQYDLKRIQISLDSLEPEYHEKVRGKYSHRFAIDAIERLISKNIPTQISTVSTASNIEQIPLIVEYGKNIGAEINVAPVSRNGFAKNIPQERWDSEFRSATRYHSEDGNSLNGAVPLCQSTLGYVAISFSGDLKPCNQKESYFAPTADVALKGIDSKWWERDFGESELGRAVAELPFDARGMEITRSNNSVCDLQNFLLSR